MTSFIKNTFKFFLTSIILTSFYLYPSIASDFSGKVLDKMNNPISYVSVICFQNNGRQFGSITDTGGEFTLNIDKNKIDSIYFSSIGYKSYKMYAPKFNGFPKQIILTPDNYQLDEVTVSAKRKRTYRKILGTHRHFSNAIAGDGIDGITKISHEIATYIENTENKEGVLRNVKIRLVSNTNPEIPLRLHIYSAVDANTMPQKQILDDVVLIQQFEPNDNWIRADLERYNLKFPIEGLFIGVEFLPMGQARIDTRQRRVGINRSEFPNADKYPTLNFVFDPKGKQDYTWTTYYHGKALPYSPWYNQNEYTNPLVNPFNMRVGLEVIFEK